MDAEGRKDNAVTSRERVKKTIHFEKTDRPPFAVLNGQMWIAARHGLTMAGLLDLPALLRARGILVRDCAGTPGLGKGWFRIAVRTPEENDRLLSAVKEELR